MIALFTETIYRSGGGSQFAALNYVLGLQSLGQEVSIITMDTGYARKIIRAHHLSGLFLQPIWNQLVTFDLAKPLRVFKQNKPTHIIVNECFSTYWIGVIVGKLLGIPITAFFHTYYFKNRRTQSPIANQLTRYASNIYMRFCFAFVNQVLVPSKAARTFLASTIGILPEKIKLTSYPIFQTNHPLPVKKIEKGGVVTFLYVGRFVKAKNIGALIESLMLITDFAWQLDLIGDGAYLPTIKNLIKHYNLESKVILHGALDRPKVLELYPRYDFFISLSDMETFGFTYLEAAYHGLPVLCLKYDTTTEVVSNFPQVHWVNSLDPVTIAAAIKKYTKIHQDDLTHKNKDLQKLFAPHTHADAAMMLLNHLRSVQHQETAVSRPTSL